jgi:hypothetical protein
MANTLKSGALGVDAFHVFDQTLSVLELEVVRPNRSTLRSPVTSIAMGCTPEEGGTSMGSMAMCSSALFEPLK